MSRAPYIVGWMGSLALAFVIGLFVGRGSGTETAAPAIDQNLVTRARAPDENALIAANAERPEAPAPAPPARPEQPPVVQEASSTLERQPLDEFDAVEEAAEQAEDGGKPPR
ncbi:MAG: hypothetical protein ACT4N8_08255 [Sphingosinicella sp.]|uniref:hypothetical protein n=1 Tax=Sphingosinicella sp. TaxID=1917971 RepID=UPI0040375FD0